MLAEDLANLPQFLCEPGDIVLLGKRPSACFLENLQQAGFATPEFVELKKGRIDPADALGQRKLGGLRPWAWGPDSVELFQPLFERVTDEGRGAHKYFNDDIARLYSKAWSADLLRNVLASFRGGGKGSFSGTEAKSLAEVAPLEGRLCSELEAGTRVDTLEDALEAIGRIRDRGHQRVVVKEAFGLAGQNAIRLWEPQILPGQRKWLAHALEERRPLVIEPWLERELDFSVQLEMGLDSLKLCGYTGLSNDPRGQFLANWAEPDYSRCLPAAVADLLAAEGDTLDQLQRFYGRIFGLLQTELQRAGFMGPVSIDAFLYRTAQGECRLKPIVEINPRFTMGRLTLELMKHACPGNYGLFRLVTAAQARAEGFADFPAYASALGKRHGPGLKSERIIRRGAVCLSDPARAQACLATFEVGPTVNVPGSLQQRWNAR